MAVIKRNVVHIYIYIYIYIVVFDEQVLVSLARNISADAAK